MKSRVFSTRIEESYAKEIDHYAEENELDKSTFIKKLIIKGLAEFKLKHAIEEYKGNKISLSKAAELAGISIHEFISIMPAQNLLLHYSVEDLEEDVKISLRQ